MHSRIRYRNPCKLYYQEHEKNLGRALLLKARLKEASPNHHFSSIKSVPEAGKTSF